MSSLPAMPIGDPVEDASVATTGEAYLIPTSHPVDQIKVYCSATCYVAFGDDASPPAVADWDRAVQQAGTEEVYTRAARRGQALPYVWVAAKTGAVAVDISYFG